MEIIVCIHACSGSDNPLQGGNTHVSVLVNINI